MKPLSIAAVHTSIFHGTSRKDSLAQFIARHIPNQMIHEEMILAVTSKIVSVNENRMVAKSSIDKAALIDREAEVNLGPIAYGSILTIKENLLIASAGIDESNSESGDYILFPEKPFASARELHNELREIWKLRKLGVILTDSKTSPMRLGVTGVSLAYWGFKGIADKVGVRDLFHRPMQMTKVNIADGLAAAATLTMGETNEARPLAVISGANVEFHDAIDENELRTRLEDDLYYPLLKPLIR